MNGYFLFCICLLVFLNCENHLLAQEDLKNVDENEFVELNFIHNKINYKNYDVSRKSPDAEFYDIDLNTLNDVLSTKPKFIKFTINFKDVNHQVKLKRNKILSDDFVLTNQNDQNLQYQKSVHYKGIVENIGKSLVAFSFLNGKLRGVISTFDAGNLVIDKLNENDVYIAYHDKNLVDKPVFNCDTKSIRESNNILPKIEQNVNCNPFSIRKCVRVYYELSHGVFIGNNSSVQNTIDWITSVHNVVNVLYADNGLKVAISEIFIWQVNDPYDGTTQDNLELFKNNTNTFNGNLAHLIDYGGGGGRAFLDSLCSPSNYAFSGVSDYYDPFPFYSSTINIISHEMGHSLGSPHTHACFWNDDNTAIDSCGPIAGFSEGCDNGPIPSNGGTIMSYCNILQTGVNFSIGFHPQVEEFLINNLETKSCLGNNCIDNTIEKETTFQINQPDLNNVDINITDSIFTSWDYRFYDISNGPTGAFTTTNSKDLNFNNIINNTYYRFELGTNCIADDGTNSYKYFQNREFLSDAEWCNLLVYFTDTGGLNGSYQKNNEILKTFYPNSFNEKLTIQFFEFETLQQDQMLIYDGTSINAPLFDNGILSGSISSQPTFTATNSEGAITVFFESFDSNVQTPAGWKAAFTCETFSTDEFIENDIKLYPNPFVDQINIQSDFPIDDLVIYSINGQRVYQNEFSNQSNLNIKLNDLSSGVYLMEISNGESSITKRLIKK